jgi:hypothetical protein
MTDFQEERRDLLRVLARCERYGMHEMARAYAAQLEALSKEN